MIEKLRKDGHLTSCFLTITFLIFDIKLKFFLYLIANLILYRMTYQALQNIY